MNMPRNVLRAATLAAVLAHAPLAAAWDHAFLKFPEAFALDTDGALLLHDIYLPAVRAQDRLGFCYAFQAAYVLENQRCLRGAPDCRYEAPADRLSTLALSLHEHEAVGTYMQEGGDGYLSVARALANAANGVPPHTERCAPYHQLTESAADKPLDTLFGLLSVRYSDELPPELADSPFAGADPAVAARDIIEQGYPAIVAWDGLLDAEQQAAQNEEPLYVEVAAARLLVPAACDDAPPLPGSDRVGSTPVYAPGDPAQPEDYYRSVMAIITEQLAQQRVVGINVCMAELPGQVATPEACGGYMHAVTVTGYGRFCREDGCADALRILNSWGTDWQDDFRGGWVFAPALVEKLPVNHYTEALFFLHDREPAAAP